MQMSRTSKSKSPIDEVEYLEFCSAHWHAIGSCQTHFIDLEIELGPS